MSHIVADDQQAALIKKAVPVQVIDKEGNLIGYVTPAPIVQEGHATPSDARPSDEEIAEAKARLAAGPRGPTYTTAQMLEYLRSLDQE